MTTLTEGTHAGEFIVSECDEGTLSRDTVTIVSGSGVITAGMVLGKITAGGTSAASAAKSGGNTGNGALTLDATTPVLPEAVAGVYLVRAIANAFDGAIAAAAGNTGDGTAAMHTTETAAGVVAGVYKAVFVEAATDFGRFVVEDPAGVVIGQGVVGTLFDGVVKFTISDGATDFLAGDAFNITVTAVVAADSGVFSVTSPSGAALGNYTIGGSAFASHIKFAIADGSTDFIVGDGFDVTVTAADAGKYKPYDDDNTDGSDTALAIAYAEVDATSADVSCVVISRMAEVKLSALQWASTNDATDKANGLADLATLNIIAR